MIHLVQYGLVACLMEMPPVKWPDGHRWSSQLADVTCPDCKQNATEMPPTFELLNDGKAILCRICGAKSHHHKDVEHHYCGWCKVWHDDLWPPARAMLIGHPERVGARPFSNRLGETVVNAPAIAKLDFE